VSNCPSARILLLDILKRTGERIRRRDLVGKTLTCTHVVDATSAKFITEFVSCSEAEVGDCYPKAIVEAEDVLWLQISLVNTERVAVFHCVEQLEEDVPCSSVPHPEKCRRPPLLSLEHGLHL